MSGVVFINYKRKDASGEAGWLRERLEQEHSPGKIFFDVDSVPPGEDFVTYLGAQVEACDVFLAIIGPHWLGELDKKNYEEGEQTRDYGRIEIEAALSKGKKVIPVLVGGTEMPHEEDLPNSMQPFARRNAVRLSHERFKADAAGISKVVKAALTEAEGLRAATAEEAARQRAAEERRAKAEQEEKERAEKEAARREAIAGLSSADVAKAEELANWNFIAERNDPQELRDHLARFPNGVCSHMALEKLESLLWSDLGEAPTIAALSAFLEEFPEGAHATEAHARVDELRKSEADQRAAAEWKQKELAAWNAVKGTTDSETLQAFLREWPDSPHEDEALRLKKALEGGMSTWRKVLLGACVAAIVAALAAAVTTSMLLNLPQSAIRTFEGHEAAVTSVAFAPDGQTALSGAGAGWDYTVQLWDVATGKELRTFKGSVDDVTSVAFAPDRKTALSGSMGSTLKLWDVATGKELRTFKGHKGWVLSVAFAPDGRTALSGSNDDTLKLWDVATGTELRAFKGHEDDVTSVAFAPDGQTALSGSKDRTLKLWSVYNGE